MAGSARAERLRRRGVEENGLLRETAGTMMVIRGDERLGFVNFAVPADWTGHVTAKSVRDRSCSGPRDETAGVDDAANPFLVSDDAGRVVWPPMSLRHKIGQYGKNTLTCKEDR